MCLGCPQHYGQNDIQLWLQYTHREVGLVSSTTGQQLHKGAAPPGCMLTVLYVCSGHPFQRQIFHLKSLKKQSPLLLSRGQQSSLLSLSFLWKYQLAQAVVMLTVRRVVLRLKCKESELTVLRRFSHYLYIWLAPIFKSGIQCFSQNNMNSIPQSQRKKKQPTVTKQ